MKTLPTLLLLAFLITGAAWLSLQGVSQAKNLPPPNQGAPPFPAPVAPRSVPASVKPAPPPPPVLLLEAKASERQTALQHALEGEDPCVAANLLESASDAEFYGALLGAIDGSGDLLETYGPNGPMLAAKIPENGTAHYKSLGARTIWALKVGGLASTPVSTSGTNAARARELLLELEKLEPGNAFYPLFRLALESQLSYPIDQLKATAETAAGCTTLDSHLRDLEHEISDASWRTPAMYYAISNFHASSVVRYYNATRVLDRLERDAGFRGKSRIAELLGEEGLHSDRSAYDGGFDSLRYSAAHLLDPTRVPGYDELSRREGWAKSRQWPNLIKIGEGRATCEPTAYEAYFYEAREQR